MQQKLYQANLTSLEADLKAAWMDCECKAEQLADSEKKFEVQTDELIIIKEHQAGWRKKALYMK